jgi:hypothetical protein
MYLYVCMFANWRQSLILSLFFITDCRVSTVRSHFLIVCVSVVVHCCCLLVLMSGSSCCFFRFVLSFIVDNLDFGIYCMSTKA